MKLHNLITSITEAQAVQYYSSGDKNVVAYYDGEYYSVDNFGVFDLEDVHFMYVDYQSLDLIKLLDWIRSSEDTKELVNSLYSKETFTNMSRTSSIKQEIQMHALNIMWLLNEVKSYVADRVGLTFHSYLDLKDNEYNTVVRGGW